MRIALAGDWHMNYRWAVDAVESCIKAGIQDIYHLGDFGLMGKAEHINSYLDVVSAALGDEATLYVTLGNHENWDWVREQTFEDGLAWVRPNIALFARGHKFTVGNLTFLSVSGASSIDFMQRIRGEDWWLGENITPDEADAIIANLIPGEVDIMLCHDAPFGVPELDVAGAATGWPLNARRYAEASRKELTRIFRVAMPAQLWHGHWHRRVRSVQTIDGVQTAFYGLDREWTQENLAILDVSSLEVFKLNILGEVEAPVGASFAE